jgi:hypothetical protein
MNAPAWVQNPGGCIFSMGSHGSGLDPQPINLRYYIYSQWHYSQGNIYISVRMAIASIKYIYKDTLSSKYIYTSQGD